MNPKSIIIFALVASLATIGYVNSMSLSSSDNQSQQHNGPTTDQSNQSTQVAQIPSKEGDKIQGQQQTGKVGSSGRYLSGVGGYELQQSYVQPEQSYSPPAQTYSLPVSTYSAPVQSYSQPQLSYSSTPSYGASSSYGGSSYGGSSLYQAPVQQSYSNYSAPSYQAPVQQSYGSSYSAPVSSYSVPLQTYSAPVSTYSAPTQSYSSSPSYGGSYQQQPAYQAPVQQSYSNYSAPSYQAPVQQSYGSSYSVPVQTYSAPVQTYSAPIQTYSAPVSTYSAPVSTYSAPVSTYSAPVQTYEQPIAQTYAAAPSYGASNYSTQSYQPSYQPSYQAPVQQSYGSSYQAPVQQSYGSSYQAPVQQSYGNSYQAPVQQSYGSSYQAPVQQSYGSSYQTPVSTYSAQTTSYSATPSYGQTSTYQTPSYSNYSTPVYQAPVQQSYGSSYQTPVSTYSTPVQTYSAPTYEIAPVSSYSNYSTPVQSYSQPLYQPSYQQPQQSYQAPVQQSYGSSYQAAPIIEQPAYQPQQSSYGSSYQAAPAYQAPVQQSYGSSYQTPPPTYQQSYQAPVQQSYSQPSYQPLQSYQPSYQPQQSYQPTYGGNIAKRQLVDEESGAPISAPLNGLEDLADSDSSAATNDSNVMSTGESVAVATYALPPAPKYNIQSTPSVIASVPLQYQPISYNKQQQLYIPQQQQQAQYQFQQQQQQQQQYLDTQPEFTQAWADFYQPPGYLPLAFLASYLLPTTGQYFYANLQQQQQGQQYNYNNLPSTFGYVTWSGPINPASFYKPIQPAYYYRIPPQTPSFLPKQGLYQQQQRIYKPLVAYPPVTPQAAYKGSYAKRSMEVAPYSLLVDHLAAASEANSTVAVECPAKPKEYTGCPQVFQNITKEELQKRICDYENILSGVINFNSIAGEKSETRCGVLKPDQQKSDKNNKYGQYESSSSSLVDLPEVLGVIIPKECCAIKSENPIHILLKTPLQAGSKHLIPEAQKIDLLNIPSITNEELVSFLKQCPNKQHAAHNNKQQATATSTTTTTTTTNSN